MAAKYIQIDPVKFENMLKACGFGRRIIGGQIVYVRFNDHYRYVVVKVWTTIYEQSGSARKNGKDSIRVSAAYESEIPIANAKRPALAKHNGQSDFGIWKSPHIKRSGAKQEDVLERVYERMREAYAFTNQWIRDNWDELPKK